MKQKILKQDIVLKAIPRAKKGINIGTIMKRTGFTHKSVTAILYKLKKNGKIEKIGNGIYKKI
jgi:hypothetical protein